MNNETTIAEWGWRAAISFIVTGALGLIALTIRAIIPILGERLHRVYGERAFKAELDRSRETSAAVAEMKPIVESTAKELDELQLRVESGFARLENKVDRVSDNVLLLAKEIGRDRRTA